ncbi:MAG: hypothetical protein LBF86_01865 [Helicobacteraceae bacterium]|nr:hypothetical protein [Helicobacteraceae bacterium]
MNEPQIKNLGVIADGEVKGLTVGIIAGTLYQGSIITNSYAIGSVVGNSNAGGIAGNAGAGSAIENSYSGGYIASIGSGSTSAAGGIAGSASGDIANCYSTADVVSAAGRAGGIAGGQGGDIEYTYALGTVSGAASSAGGISGNNGTADAITRYNAAINESVSATSAKRVTQLVTSATTHNFARSDMLINGDAVSDGNAGNGSGKALSAFKKKETYSYSVAGGGLGWSFGEDDNAPWVYVENDYPKLYWQKDSRHVTNASVPNITAQPQNAAYTEGATAAPISVSVAPLTDGGSLSYQWYSSKTNDTSAGVAIKGARGASYIPPAASDKLGYNYYYVVVTNTNLNAGVRKMAKVVSQAARVEVSKHIGAEPPVITDDLQLSSDGNLTITAKSNDGGTIYYQWYRGGTNSVYDGELQAVNQTGRYAPTSDDGTFYYYAIVVNHNDNVPGEINATLVSAIVKLHKGDYTLRFYDADLNLVHTETIATTTADLSSISHTLSNIYEALGESDLIAESSYALSYDTNFYAVSKVTELQSQADMIQFYKNTQSTVSSVKSAALSGRYILLGDITLREAWTSIGVNGSAFSGIFNGNGHKIRASSIVPSGSSYAGLFGYISGGKVRNLGLEVSGEISASQYAGGIAGYVTGSAALIENCYVKANIRTSSSYAGGITGGLLSNGAIKNSYFIGNVRGTEGVGGIAGYVNQASVTNSYAVGNLIGDSASSGYVGGIAGRLNIPSSNPNVIQNNAAIISSITTNVSTDVNRAVGGSATHVSDNIALAAMTINGSTKADDANLNGTGKTDSDLKSQSTYEALGWDFTNVWKMPDGGGYPILKWERP